MWAGLLIAALMLTACSGPGTESPVEPPPAELTPGAAQAPVPAVRTALTLCAVGRPLDPFDGSPVSEALLALLTPDAIRTSVDYRVEGSELFAALPSVDSGTLSLAERTAVRAILRYRDDLVWSDGTPFSIDDALLGLKLPARPDDPPFEIIWLNTPDDGSIEVVAAPGAAYPYAPAKPPLPAHALSEPMLAQPGWQLFGVTLGRYYISGLADDAYTLARNPYYAAQQPLPFETIRLTFLADPVVMQNAVAAGACDLALDGFGAADAVGISASGAQLISGEQPLIDHLVFNANPGLDRPALFADPRVRQAVAMALDRGAISAGYSAGLTPRPEGWLPLTHWAYSPSQGPSGDSSALLAEAGWLDGDEDGVREYAGTGGSYACNLGGWSLQPGTQFRPKLIIPAGDAVREQIAQTVVSTLGPLGIAVQIEAVDPASYFSGAGPVQGRGFDLALLAIPIGADPGGISRWVGQETFLHPVDGTVVFESGLEARWLVTDQLVERLSYNNTPSMENGFTGQNYSGWCDEASTLAIVEASLRLSPADRLPFYATAQQAIVRGLPVVPLYQRARVFAAGPALCGIELRPLEPVTWNIEGWTLSQGGGC